MVATLVKLRFLLLANSLKKSPWQIVAVVIGGLYALGVLVTVIVGLVALSFASVELARTVVILAGSLLIAGWVVGPVLTSGIDQTVDPARLATFPISTNSLILGLTASGVLGIPGMVTAIAALSTALTWWKSPLIAVIALLTAAVGVLTCVVGSRMIVALTARIGGGRRIREAKGIILIVPLILAGPIVLGVSQIARETSASFPAVAEVLSWTPLGAIWAVPSEVANGNGVAAVLKLLIGLATLAVSVVLWRWGLARALERPANSTAAKASVRGLGFFARFPGTPTGAVAARALTYWIRDPRYAQSLISVPLIPVLIFFYAGSNGNLGPLNAVGPIIAVLLSMSIYTDVSYDNTAFALHLQTGVSGRADRLGRVIALATFAVPISLALTVASVWITGQWQLLPGLLGITIGALLSGFAVSSIVSGAFAFAVPAPGESPFKSKPGGGFSLMLSMFATWAILGVLVLPELILAIVGFATGNALLGWLSIVVGLGLGTVLLIVGVRVGGSIYERRGPELLTKLKLHK
ncbi:MAG: transporter [Rhodoglobus sp.]